MKKTSELMVTKRSRGKLINRAAAAPARLALSAVEILIKRLMACSFVMEHWRHGRLILRSVISGFDSC